MTLRTRIAAVIAAPASAAAIVIGGILLIAGVDFLSGIELRVFPLYYAPIALAAWSLGHRAALAAAVASATGWLLANRLAGQEYSHPLIWVANTVVQGASFAIIGYLVAYLRRTLLRERTLSRTDSLSGLMNPRAFYEESDRLLRLCRRGRRPITLAYLDLDNFKIVNDIHGHRAGDDLIRAVGEALQAALRASDLTARLGGDEFAILLPELAPPEATVALHRLREAINRTVAAVEASAVVTVSIGAVTQLVAPDNIETMVHDADTVMYRAKKAGKNQVIIEARPAPV